jgi:small multidrug resistance pump
MLDFKPTVPQAWLMLSAAILFEVGGTTCMKLSEGLQRLTPSMLIFVFYGIAFSLNTFVVRTLDLSVTYAVWSGVGTALTALIGIYYFKEPATAFKLVSIGLIVIGVLGLHSASRMKDIVALS